ncbi:hypothetical protein BDY24DRAFT_417218 [Mrakia frigida]|uniref:uncharacterized protein n=1 Tax=Mrakia frigida TaxID=29902 RepID=UPI003FCC0E1D
MGRNGGTYSTTPAKGGGGRRGSAASNTSYNSPTMSESFDGRWIGLLWAADGSGGSVGGWRYWEDIGRLEKEVIGFVDFANTLLSYRQALEGLIQVTKTHPLPQEFRPLRTPLIAPTVAAESTKATRARLDAFLHRRERVQQLRSTLAEINRGGRPRQEAVTTWLAETNIAADLSVDETKLVASCFLGSLHRFSHFSSSSPSSAVSITPSTISQYICFDHVKRLSLPYPRF